MLLRMVLFSIGSASLFACAFLAYRFRTRPWVQIAAFASTAVVSLVLYFDGSFSPLPVAADLAAFAAALFFPAIAGSLSARFASRGQFPAARALALVRFGLTGSRGALATARIIEGLEIENTSGFQAALRHFSDLRLSRAATGLERMVDAAFIELSFRRNLRIEALPYLESAGSPADFAKAGPDAALQALEIYCVAGKLDDAALLLSAMADLHPSAVPLRALAEGYVIYLCASGEGDKVAVVRAAELLASENRKVSNPNPATDAATPAPGAEWALSKIPWPPRFAAGHADRIRPFAMIPVSRAYATIALVLANVLVMAALMKRGETEDPVGLAAFGANVDFLVRSGQAWRWGSSTFIHFGLLHLVMNMAALYVLGRFCEGLYGSARTLLVYLAAGFAGSVASFYITSPQLSAGASGAVFGLLGMGLAFTLVHGSKISPSFRNRYLAVFAFIIAADVAFGLAETYIDNAAHIGGLLCGGLVSVFLAPTSERKGGFPRAGGLALAALLLAASGAMAWCVYKASENLAGGGVIPDSIDFVRTRFGDRVSAEIPAHWKTKPQTGPDVYYCVLPFAFSKPWKTGSALEGTIAQYESAIRDAVERRFGADNVRQMETDDPRQIRFIGRFDNRGSEEVQLTVFVLAGTSLLRMDFNLRERNLRVFSPVIDRIVRSVEVD